MRVLRKIGEIPNLLKRKKYFFFSGKKNVATLNYILSRTFELFDASRQILRDDMFVVINNCENLFILLGTLLRSVMDALFAKNRARGELLSRSVYFAAIER